MTEEHNIENLLASLGEETVLLPVPKGEKGPRLKGWVDIGAEDMASSDYIKNLRTSPGLAVLCGPASDNLICIDVDDRKRATKFLRKLRRQFPDMAKKMLVTKTHRGIHVWFRISGEYPECTHQIALCDDPSIHIGELRAGKCCTKVAGDHPKGGSYSLEGTTPIACAFEEIPFPKSWDLPWTKTAYDQILEKHGPPYRVSDKGHLSLNEPSAAECYLQSKQLIWEPQLKKYFLYCTTTGSWKVFSDERLKADLSDYLRKLADKDGDGDSMSFAANSSVLTRVATQIRGRSEESGFFDGRKLGFVHSANKMIEAINGKLREHDFSPEFRSRGQLPYTRANAVCPRFLEFLADCLDPPDIETLQKILGQFLTGFNESQSIALLSGPSGSGKSTLLRIISLVLEDLTFEELMTSKLDRPFEVASFEGAHGLLGLDVPANFLESPAAHNLKSLVGGDRTKAERKYSNDRIEIPGVFPVLITSNAELTVGINDDADAWKRRLVYVRFRKPKYEKPIPRLAEEIATKERDGIFEWLLDGLARLSQDLQETGAIVLTSAQVSRRNEALSVSDPLQTFLAEKVTRVESGAVTTQELFSAYREFCKQEKKPVISLTSFSRQVGTILQNE